MSLYDYEISKELGIGDPPFYALIMAAMRKADDDNLELLKSVFPDTWNEFYSRYHTLGGILDEDNVEKYYYFGHN